MPKEFPFRLTISLGGNTLVYKSQLFDKNKKKSAERPEDL